VSERRRVEFDRHFNAITGLNGSGKSNVFDAICFVMGITSLSHVRVSNLQELIYKQGNSGIEKASVTLTFARDGPEGLWPSLMQDRSEITITRQIVRAYCSSCRSNKARASTT
jgi:structural maintenance of chromosome 2